MAEQFELLRYSDTVLKICTKGWSRRELHNLQRQVMLYPKRIIICNCLKNPWIRESVTLLGAQWSPATEQCNVLSKDST